MTSRSEARSEELPVKDQKMVWYEECHFMFFIEFLSEICQILVQEVVFDWFMYVYAMFQVGSLGQALLPEGILWIGL